MSDTKEEKETKKIKIKTVEIATNKAEPVASRKEQENNNKKEKK